MRPRSQPVQPARVRHAEVSWCAEDIKEFRPEWDDARCNTFLTDNEDDIQAAMVMRGWDAISDLLRMENDE